MFYFIFIGYAERFREEYVYQKTMEIRTLVLSNISFLFILNIVMTIVIIYDIIKYKDIKFVLKVGFKFYHYSGLF